MAVAHPCAKGGDLFRERGVSVLEALAHGNRGLIRVTQRSERMCVWVKSTDTCVGFARQQRMGSQWLVLPQRIGQRFFSLVGDQRAHQLPVRY